MDASLANFNAGVASTWAQTTVDFISEPPKIDYDNPKTAAAATNIMLNAFRGEMTDIIQCSDLPQSVKHDAIAKLDMMIDAALKPGVDSDIQCAVQDVFGHAAENIVKDYFTELFNQMQEQQLLEQNEDALNSGSYDCKPGTGGATGSAGTEASGETGGSESGGSAQSGNEPASSFSAGAGGGNWLIKLAEALAKVQTAHLDNLMAATDRAAAAAPAGTEAAVTTDTGNGAASATNSEPSGSAETQASATNSEFVQGGGSTSEAKGTESAEYIKANAQVTAYSRLFSMASETTSNVLKTVGEGLTSIARKQ